jgi:hypothetical protein
MALEQHRAALEQHSNGIGWHSNRRNQYLSSFR